MINQRCNTRPVNRQHGVALITGLIFLVVLTFISVTTARMSGLEERMSGNMRDRSLAMQAAEMALRDAERDIRGGAGITRTPVISGLTNFDSACTAGLCYNGPAGNANGTNWTTTPIWSVINMTAAPSVAYGTNTGATSFVGLSAQPRYIIEGIEKNGSGTAIFYYRITVRAQGANANTVVWLQEVYKS
ncbi:Type IV pilus assembly protein PilX [Candidatus Nitrotoga sp. HW29]|uniref:pilus assembly PilX family protein n=1 Tax=Candidatus Nitrotoga sp. HW29 TaxID=2886963 RepID=UPI001EF1779B|nr:pilus assembly protein [Candidatus Nitrotoga sp. HW29]CAH1903694.1 Type IV pilus assembly protein PilX [Candidatus Nitrotoga sp. HW29]